MSLTTYTIGEIYISSAQGGVSFTKLAEEAQLQVSRKTNSQAVMTVAKGYAGESPGAVMCEVDVTNAVPAAGMELDPGPLMGPQGQGPLVVQFTIYAAGKTLVFNGFIIEDNFSHAVNTESKLTFKARGEFSLWT